jgi:predicted dehydrogenase
MSNHQPTRRAFLTAASAASLTLLTSRKASAQDAQPPADTASASRLNVAFVGVGGRGANDLEGVARHANVAALCDVDTGILRGAASKHPKAKTYQDARRLLDDAKSFDAIVVATPDHMHAPISIAAMQLGKHVYCEKPIAHDVYEARRMAEAAKKYKVITQMGTQAHSSEGTRLVVEFIRAGAIGNVTEVHTWTDRPTGWWPQGFSRPSETADPPKNLDWKLWLGCAPEMPYYVITNPTNPSEKVGATHTFRWRGWREFGTGAMGDMACHIIDAAYWALDLVNPVAVQAKQNGLTDLAWPNWSAITYEFAANANRPALKLHWYDAIRFPPGVNTDPDLNRLPGNGSVFIGDKGKMVVPYGDAPRLVPESAMKNFKRPEKTLPRVEGGTEGHHKNWVDSILNNKPATSNFEYAGPLNEVVMLGNVAVRAGKRIEWDAEKLEIKNDSSLNHLIKRDQYRNGWSV